MSTTISPAFRTARDATVQATVMLADDESLGRIWRHVVLQMLDDYRSVLRHQGATAAAAMWEQDPGGTGDSRVDAALAALAEHLAHRDGWPVPAWSRRPQRQAWPLWFVTELRGLHARALVESPAAFRKRGVFIAANDLDRA